MQIVPAEAKPGGNAEAMRFLLKTKPANLWNVQYAVTIPAALTEGRKLEMRFWGRSKTATPLQAVFEKGGEPYTKSLYEKVALTSDWKEFVLPFTTPAYPAGGARASLQMGLGVGEIEIAGLRLIDTEGKPAKFTDYPAAGTDLLLDVPFLLSTPAPENVVKTVPAEGRPGGFDTALRVTINKPAIEMPWTIQLQAVPDAPIANNQVMLLKFWGRSKTKSVSTAIYEMHRDPYVKTLNVGVGLSPTWKEYAYVITSPAYPPQGYAVNFQLGFGKGEAEFAGIRLLNYGVNPKEMPKGTAPEWYGGMTHDDSWRTAANERIDKFRKGNLVVNVVDASGKPLSGAQVTINQRKHAFRWGTALSPLVLDNTLDGEKYRQTVTRLFNYVVLENQLKWDWTENAGYSNAEKMIAWCKKRNIPVRGHNLFWPGYEFAPPSLKKFQAQAGKESEIRAAVEKRVREVVGKFKGELVVWDAVNEALSSHAIYDDAGGRALVADVFKWAYDVDPKTPLAYNENEIFQISDDSAVGAHDAKLAELLTFLKAQKAPVSVLGLQSHMGAPLVPGGLLAKNLELLRKLNLPMEVTEFDAGIPDDKIHAQYTDEFMTAAFAEPSLTSFVMWGFWEGAHWRAKEGGAMIRQDWTERPSAKVYENLVFDRWWTKATGKTDKSGVYRTRAFLGTQEITVKRGNETKTTTIEVTKNQEGTTTATVSL